MIKQKLGDETDSDDFSDNISSMDDSDDENYVPGTAQQKNSKVKKSLFTSGIENESKGKAEKRKMKRTTPAKDTVIQEPRKKNTKRQ